MKKKKKKKIVKKKKKKGKKKKKKQCMAQYLVKYWMNVDVLAEEVIDSENINMETNDLGKYNEPTKEAKYKILDSIKINRRSYEKYDEKLNDSSKKPSSDK